VPHPTTLPRLTRRVGKPVIAQLNQALLHRAAERKLLRTHKVRVDTTVVGANVAYPTDLGLLARAVDKAAQHGQAGAGGWGCDPQPGPGPSAGDSPPRA
jgi:IS5 family transposase